MKQLFKNYIRDFFKLYNLNFYKTNPINLDKFIKKLFIYDVGHELIRIGNPKGDGGYLVPNILDQIDYCFSPGVGNNTTFEDHLQEYGIQSFLADGTKNQLNIPTFNNKPYDFIKKNLNSYNDNNNITLRNWVEDKIGIKNESLLLQMDIENNEIPVLYQCDLDFLKRFKILTIEFHDFQFLGNDFGLRILTELFDKILLNFTICHIHPNNCCGCFKVNNYLIPRLMEITFINKNSFKKSEKLKKKLPNELDHKCVKRFNDLILPDYFYK